MATLNDYFRTEARDFLNALERSLERSPAPDVAELHRAVRGLRGTAQMAREQRIFDVVSAFESVTRAIADGALAWSDDIAESARETIADLRVLLDPAEEEEQLDARANEAAARWREADPDPTPIAAAPIVDPGTREFREFAAREAADIADALDHGIAELQANPMNREPLTIILRRQRALLGSARLEEIPVIADILRAVEDLTRVIVKLDVGVKQEWLDIYRVARDALQTTIAPLLRDELPQSSNSVSRLRHMRAELLERYGSAADASSPAGDPLARTGTLPGDPSAPRAATPPPHPHAPGAATLPPHPRAPGAATLPGDTHAPRSGTVPAAPFMGPARSAPQPSAPAPAHAPPPVSSAAAGAPPVPGRPPAPADDVLQLQEANVVETADAGTFESADGAAAGAAEADLDMLELGDDDMIDATGADVDTLELGDDDIIDATEADVDTLELGDEDIIDAAEADVDTLELGEDDITDDDGQMLDLSSSAVEENPRILQLDDGGLDDDAMVIELEGEAQQDAPAADTAREETAAADTGGTAVSEVDTSAAAPMYSRHEALQRALELRGVIERVAAHDPKAREAVDELFTLLKTALG